jgi:hypothetical protein
MVCPRWWDLSRCWSSIVGVANEHFPAVGGILELIQVKCHKIVHEVAFNLTTKNINFRTNYV